MKNQKATNEVIEVFSQNFLEEINNLSVLLDKLKYISLDTEFPGTIYTKYTHPDLGQFELLKKNIDDTNPIQIGITLSSGLGGSDFTSKAWQFNLKYDLSNETYSKDSISMLQNCGLDFEKIRKHGIDPIMFGEYFLASGAILNPEISWITFQGLCDFAYLLKIVTNDKLASNKDSFISDLELYFPNYYDIKFISEKLGYSPGSLNKLAVDLGVRRIGTQHQAGSDALLTLNCCKRLSKEGNVSLSTSRNFLFNFGPGNDAIIHGAYYPKSLPNFYQVQSMPFYYFGYQSSLDSSDPAQSFSKHNYASKFPFNYPFDNRISPNMSAYFCNNQEISKFNSTESACSIDSKSKTRETSEKDKR